jgi:2-keto-4-pentenoate hydratase/2-oxohepta-3-ene-1,7-dioic acid hydratase in catechol pathway
MRIGNLAGRLTLITDDGGVDVHRASDGIFDADPQAVYERWEEFTEWAATAKTDGATPFAREDLGAPAPVPRQVFGIGMNYKAHAEEAGSEVPEYPIVFTKYVSSFIGPTGDIVVAGDTVDWEVELVAIIGKRAYEVDADHAWEHVAGVTVGQDISDRTLQLRGVLPQLALGKSRPGFSPSGPWLVTPDEFNDPDDLELGCSINGEQMQLARTSDLIFPIPTLIADLSAILALLPGDVIYTGTPGGVGVGLKPPRFLAPGDVLVSTVEGVGQMRHHFVSA